MPEKPMTRVQQAKTA